MNEQKDAREQKHLKILIYGAGVIGSLYAALLSEAGYQVAVFARGYRLTTLLNKGLLYKQDSVWWDRLHKRREDCGGMGHAEFFTLYPEQFCIRLKSFIEKV